MDKNKVPKNIQQYTKLIDRKIADIIINTHYKTYRDYCIGDIVSIYDVPHKIHRIESTYFSSIEPDGDLVHWGWDEVEDIPINEFWAKQFNFTIIDTSEHILDYEGIVYIKSVNCLAYVFQGEYTTVTVANFANVHPTPIKTDGSSMKMIVGTNQDNQWEVTEEGNYKIIVDINTMRVTFIKK
jgi:hypothetical protein